MSERNDTEAKASLGASETPAVIHVASAVPVTTAADQQISLSLSGLVNSLSGPANSLSAPVKFETPSEPVAVAPIIQASKPVETPKVTRIPRPVEAAMQAVDAMKAKETARSQSSPEPVSPPKPAAAASVATPAIIAGQMHSSRFALLAASIAFASAIGAMAGAVATTMIARSGPAQSPIVAIDLSSVQNSIASLKSELSSIKSSVDSSHRNSNAQFAKFTERFERIDRAQAVPATQLKQAVDAIDRLERRAQAVPPAADVTGSVRAQPAAAQPSLTPREPPQPTVLDGWVVRHVSRGVAIIQGRRMGAFQVETGDIVPGVGRIESIRRQEGRWVVLTSRGMIASAR